MPPPHSFPTFASGFLFLCNKQKITICKRAGGVWEVGHRALEMVIVVSLDKGLGREEQFGEKMEVQVCKQGSVEEAGLGPKSLALGSASGAPAGSPPGLSYLSTGLGISRFFRLGHSWL